MIATEYRYKYIANPVQYSHGIETKDEEQEITDHWKFQNYRVNVSQFSWRDERFVPWKNSIMIINKKLTDFVTETKILFYSKIKVRCFYHDCHKSLKNFLWLLVLKRTFFL